MRISFKTLLCLLICCALWLSVAGAADVARDSQIIFLQLQFDQSGVTLLSSQVVPGKLKELRVPEQREIVYEATDDSTIVYKGAIDNPLVKRLEYEDPENPGRLKMKVVEVATAPVIIRLPYRENLRELTFYRVETGKATTDASSRTKIGSVDLSSIGGER